jgi:hypothetical protein
MRNRLYCILFGLFAAVPGLAQFSFEKVYDYSLTATKINQTDYKYYLMDVLKSECRIYTTDHTLWKTIPVSLPSGYYLNDVKFVSENLFNTDAAVELWYSAYEWVTTGTSTGYYRYISKVITEKGAELASIPGGAYAYIVQTGTDVYKLTVYAYDNSVSPYTVKTYLYALPNPSSASNFVTYLPGDPFPNPAGDFINLPLNEQDGKSIVQVFAVSGQKMTETYTNGLPVFHLNTKGWSPGVYTYRLVKDGYSSKMKQFVVR